MAPVQPKKPVGGAYGAFTAENRAKFTKATEGQPVSAVSKMAGEEWKKLSDEEKKPFQKKYEDAKAKYEKDMEAFLAAGGVKEKGAAALRSEKRKEKEGKTKKKKDPDAPKKPATPYFAFLNENREAITKKLPAGHKITEVTKQGAKDWAALTADEKKPYEEKFQKLSEEYKKALEEYKAANGGADEEEDSNQLSSPEKAGAAPKAKRARKNDDAKNDDAKASPPAKKGRKGKNANPPSPSVKLDDAILKAAEELNMGDALRNLASREEMVKEGVTSDKLFEALKASDGLVNKAKAALLAAGA